MQFLCPRTHFLSPPMFLPSSFTWTHCSSLHWELFRIRRSSNFKTELEVHAVGQKISRGCLPTQNKIPLSGHSLVMIISCQVTNYSKNLMAYNNNGPSIHRHIIWRGLGRSSSDIPGSHNSGWEKRHILTNRMFLLCAGTWAEQKIEISGFCLCMCGFFLTQTSHGMLGLSYNMKAGFKEQDKQRMQAYLWLHFQSHTLLLLPDSSSSRDGHQGPHRTHEGNREWNY